MSNVFTRVFWANVYYVNSFKPENVRSWCYNVEIQGMFYCPCFVIYICYYYYHYYYYY